MGNLAIIPARGGSKRIPQKNIKHFVNKPIIAYSIEAALASGLFEEVMVSTDDLRIAEIAVSYGAQVPFMRSAINADDHATTISVINEVLSDYKSVQDKIFNYACCIYPTAPLIQKEHLAQGFEMLQKSKYSSVLPIVKFGYPIWRALKIDNNKTNFVWPEYMNRRSQDLTNSYHDAGQWYWFDPQQLNDSLISENSGYVILSELEVQDIDSLSDWQIAELKYTNLKNSGEL